MTTMMCIRCRVVDRETRRSEVDDRFRFLRRRHPLPNPMSDIAIATEDCLALRSLRSAPTSPSLFLIPISTADELRVPVILPSTISSSTTFPVSRHRETTDSSRRCAPSREGIVDRRVLANPPKPDSHPILRITRLVLRMATRSPLSITPAIFVILRRPAPLRSPRSIPLRACSRHTTISRFSLRCSTRRAISSLVHSPTTPTLQQNRLSFLFPSFAPLFSRFAAFFGLLSHRLYHYAIHYFFQVHFVFNFIARAWNCSPPTEYAADTERRDFCTSVRAGQRVNRESKIPARQQLHQTPQESLRRVPVADGSDAAVCRMNEDGAARYPFDKATLAALDAEGLPSPLFRLKRYIRALPFISPSILLVLALSLLAGLHGAGLVLFGRGFLLTRLALQDINSCSPITSTGNLDPSCSILATHSKLVFIVIDALRADFVFPVPASPSSDLRSFYQNHITLPATLTAQDPTRSFLSHFIADAPTTTLQRLKGITTGSLPTFVDAGSNFAGERVTEDNWLGQAKRAGKRIAMMGDDTWLAVFPKGEGSVWDDSQVWPYDSFNVEDLDTVDAGVVSHLLPLLDENKAGKGTWDVIIAHSLGLDHAGHRFGPSHAEATRKLVETQRLLEQVVERLDEDTLLVVMGDHGMTDQGDHGGDSREEVDAALWIYSKGAALTDSTFFDHPLDSSTHPLAALVNASRSSDELGDRLQIDWSGKGVANARAVSQVDIVPTLSLLLGLPVPFGNLGLVIPELFYRQSSLPIALSREAAAVKARTKRGFFGISNPAAEKRPEETLSPLQTLLQASLLTSSQLSIYLSTYTSSSAGADLLPSMPELTFILSLAKSAYRGAHAPGHIQQEMEFRALEKFWTYGRKAREKARAIWARFDMVLMAAGLAVWIGSIAVGVRLFRATQNGSQARFLVGRAVEGVILGAWGMSGLWLVNAFALVGGFSTYWAISILAIAAEAGILAAPRTSTTPLLPSSSSILPLLPLVAHCALFASNSFTVFEDSVVLFLLSTLLILTFLRSFSAPEARLRKRLTGFSLVALVSVRLIAASTICREEQAPSCSITFHLPPGSTIALVAIGFSLVAAWFIPTLLRASLALSAADEGFAPAFLSYGVRGLLIGGVVYWGIDWSIAGLSLDAPGKLVAGGLKTGVARAVLFGGVLTASLLWSNSPLCLRIQRRSIQDAQGKEIRTEVKFFGFANGFGSDYLLYFSAVFAIFWLVNPPVAQIVLGLQLVVLLCLLEIFDSERDVEYLRSAFEKVSMEDLLSTDSAELLSTPPPSHTGPNFVQISTLALLSHLAFFGTGHQASLSTIQWSTAFIGFPTVVYPFSPLLVILNTLGPYLLTAIALPLFVFWNFSPTLKDQPPLLLIRHLIKATVAFSTYQATVGLASAIFAAHFKRHLMVWKIFAPRFMLGGITMLGTDLVIVGLALGWGALGTMRKTKIMLGTRVAE